MAEEFPIMPEKTAMLFFDCYYGSNPDGLAKLREDGYVDKLVQIEQASRKAGIPIFYTQPEHRQDGKDWPVTVVGDPDAPTLTNYAGVLYKGSHAATILPDIEPQPEDYLITKHRWSSFHYTCLELSLKTAGIDTLMLAGGATQIGIASTAYSARDYGYNLIILSDAIHSTPEIDEFFCTKIFPRFSRVMTVEKAISMFAVPVTA